MQENRRLANALYMGSVAFCIAWLTYFLFKNTVPVDTGDGLMHYFIAQATWSNPIYFLDHWGKPLFNFFASPFAQFGMNGTVVFNILVFLFSCIIGQKLMNKLKTPAGLQFIFPLILLIANDYSMTILAGLTEPLFNLLLLISALLLFNKKWMWFAIIVSFLPFARSEGQLPLVLAFILLLYNKQFKIIPFLGLGFVLYAFIGWGLKSDFWWYFTDSPYSMDNGIYGKGTWDHYLLSYRNYLGNPGLYILMVGIPTAIYFLIKRNWQFVQFELAFFAYGVFLGVVVLHSYFWATGQNGSLGLTRIATQGMPLFILIHLGYIGRMNWTKSKGALIAWCCAAFFLGLSLIKTNRYPQHPSTFELQLAKTKAFLQAHLKGNRKVYYSFPYFGYLMNENPLILGKNNTSRFYVSHSLEHDLEHRFHQGDFIVWDSHFGPKEAGLPLELIAKHKELVLVNEFIFGTESIRMYQIVPVNKQQPITQSSWEPLKNVGAKVLEKNEFTDVLPKLAIDSTQRELEVTYFSDSPEINLVFDNGNLDDYCSNHVQKGDSLVLKFQLPAGVESKLYIWNPRKVDATVSLKNCRVRKVRYPKII